MANPFEVLAGFLDRFGNEVEGRESVEPPQDILEKLRRLADGSLPASEHAALFALLEQNPKWIARLAEEVKALRMSKRQNE